jgi:hypothetical protein
MSLAPWWQMPVNVRAQMQEPEVTKDADGDGVVDFDEIQRFLTDPNHQDSDRDGVRDLQDIESGVHEVEHRYGYAFITDRHWKGRDYDRDRIPTERDPDSDEDGCRDGEEDKNGNGFHDAGETGNFDERDICGDLDGVIKYTVVTTKDYGGGLTGFHSETARIAVKLKADPTSTGNWLDDGSHYRAEASSLADLAPAGGCYLYGRTFGSGAAKFTAPGDDIGGGVGIETVTDPKTRIATTKRTMSFNAQASMQGRVISVSCLGTDRMAQEVGFATPECPGVEDPKQRGTFVFNCTGPVDPSPIDIKILVWSVSGRVRLR